MPSLVKGHVAHARFAPLRHSFRYGAHQWLVDADAPDVLPRPMRWLGSIRARDHIGDPSRRIGDNIRRFLAAQGASWTADRIVMLANARTLGYVFDPLSVFWIFDAAGALEGVVAEVHNTYGERHCYLIDVDDGGRGTTDKAFYVSPFFGVFGGYEMRFRLDDRSVAVFITLKQDDRVVFTASFEGVAVPLTTRTALVSAARQPLMPHRIAALIRLHGVWLWLRRLPVVKRLPHRTQAGT